MKKPIYQSEIRYRQAVEDVTGLQEAGVNDDLIPRHLAHEYDWQEITSLIGNLKKVNAKNKDSALVIILQNLLWIQLIFSAVGAIVILQAAPSVNWVFIMGAGGAVIEGIMLYLSYTNFRHRFLYIFTWHVIFLIPSSDSFGNMFAYPVFSYEFIKSFIWAVSYLATIVISWKLYKRTDIIMLRGYLKDKNTF